MCHVSVVLLTVAICIFSSLFRFMLEVSFVSIIRLVSSMGISVCWDFFFPLERGRAVGLLGYSGFVALPVFLVSVKC